MNLVNICRAVNSQLCLRFSRSFHRKQFHVHSDFFDNHPVDKQTIKELEEINTIRKNRANIQLVRDLFEQHESENDPSLKEQLKTKLREEFKKFPNKTHPTVLSYGPNASYVELYSHGEAHKTKNSKSYEELGNQSHTLRLSHLGNFTGSRSYYLMHSLAELEQALLRYTCDFLVKEGFELVSVPDILPDKVIEGCGMPTVDDSNQVYRLHPSELCLSGTSEMALGGYFSGRTLRKEELPKKVMAVSRCFRAEAGDGTQDKNLYRVHHFTKVEMFSVCLPTQSDEMLEQFRNIECRIFESLGLSFKLYDMPIHELGATAYRKYDVEAWIPSRDSFGEISSTSNCTDYQAKRLNIYVQDGEQRYHAHTVNGTACAAPRMIIAILEQNQTTRSVQVPEVLKPYMKQKELVSTKVVPQLKVIKNIKK